MATQKYGNSKNEVTQNRVTQKWDNLLQRGNSNGVVAPMGGGQVVAMQKFYTSAVGLRIWDCLSVPPLSLVRSISVTFTPVVPAIPYHAAVICLIPFVGQTQIIRHFFKSNDRMRLTYRERILGGSPYL